MSNTVTFILAGFFLFLAVLFWCVEQEDGE